MADEPGTQPENETDDELLLDEEAQVTPPAPEDEDEGGEEETILTFGDETEPQTDDSSVVRHLREKLRESQRREAELRKTSRGPVIEVGEKPTLESCDWDEDKFAADLLEWNKRKSAADAKKNQPSPADEATAAQWSAAADRFTEGKAKLAEAGIADVDEAQETVEAAFDVSQQAVLVMAADDPAKVMVALAKNPSKLADLAAETNPIRLAGKIAKLEGTLKMVTRRKAPAIDEPQRGSGRMSQTSSSKRLAKLKEEAEKTGDYTKYFAAKRGEK